MYYWERARTESRGRTLGSVVACAVESEEMHLSQNGRGSRVKWGGGCSSSSPHGSPLQTTDPASPPSRHYLGRSCLACLTQLCLKLALGFWSSACCPDLLLGVPIYCLAECQECEWHSRRRQAEITVMKMTGNLQRWLALWVTGLHFVQKSFAGAKKWGLWGLQIWEVLFKIHENRFRPEALYILLSW